MNLKTRAALVIAVLLASFAGFPALHSPGTLSASSQLDTKLKKVYSNHKLGSKAEISVIVMDLKTDRAVFRRGSEKALIPASNQKLLTTAAALTRLGPGFQIRTDLRYRGEITSGTLNGDLLLIGRGDPNISGRFYDGDSTQVMRKLASALTERGVKSVTGNLYFDESYFSGDRTHDEWPSKDYRKWYCAEVSALSFNDNCISISVDPQRSGKEAQVETLPPTGFVTLNGSVNTVGGKRDPVVGWDRTRSSNDIKVWGKVYASRPAFVGECTVTDPAAYFAHVFAETLVSYGIRLSGKMQRGSVPSTKGWKLVEQHCSDLGVTVSVCNERSQNLYAECIYRIAGKESGHAGSFEGGAKAVNAFLKDKGIFNKGVVVADGSGLARSNRVSARTICEVLDYMDESKNGDVYKASLAIAGKTGTMRRRLKGKQTKARVFAKTGTIRGVSSLSGYIQSESGKEYAFAILVNNHRGYAPAFADAIVSAIASNG